jgi:hypothetical protein
MSKKYLVVEESASACMVDAFQTSAACVRGMKKREAPV